jgi:hypothetical protein
LIFDGWWTGVAVGFGIGLITGVIIAMVGTPRPKEHMVIRDDDEDREVPDPPNGDEPEDGSESVVPSADTEPVVPSASDGPVHGRASGA